MLDLEIVRWKSLRLTFILIYRFIVKIEKVLY